MMSRIATAVVGALLLAGAAAAPVAAEPAFAPYAQAAARVAGNGALLLEKNIDTSRRVSAGTYCVHVSDPDIDLSTAVVTTGVSGGGAGTSVRVFMPPNASCQNDPRTLAIATTDSNFTRVDQAFYLVIN